MTDVLFNPVFLCSCISPLRYCSDFRPYFTIHDSEFKEYTTRTHAPWVTLSFCPSFKRRPNPSATAEDSSLALCQMFVEASLETVKMRRSFGRRSVCFLRRFWAPPLFTPTGHQSFWAWPTPSSPKHCSTGRTSSASETWSKQVRDAATQTESVMKIKRSRLFSFEFAGTYMQTWIACVPCHNITWLLSSAKRWKLE